jgi:hypothetical protein
VGAVAERLVALERFGPPWRVPPHWWDDARPEATARYVLLLDALNFSFWGEPRWRVAWRGQPVDGYMALAAALRGAIERGIPLLDPAYLLRDARADMLLAGLDEVPIPLLRARQAALREVGRGLSAMPGGSLVDWLGECHGSAADVARALVAAFPSFRDVEEYERREIPIYKRAQIFVSHIWGAFGGLGPGAFHDMDVLTMFADYKVPQVVHGLGILVYSDDLTAMLQRREVLPHGDAREVEIRAASIEVVERLREALEGRGAAMRSFELDWALWTLGQEQDWPLPYHRTRTVAY